MDDNYFFCSFSCSVRGPLQNSIYPQGVALAVENWLPEVKRHEESKY